MAGAPLTMLGRWLTNLVLAAVVAGLGWLVAVEHQRGVAATRLTPLVPDGISRVELRRSGAPAVVLTRDARGWQMREPLAAPADAEAVGRLLPLAIAPSSRALPVAVVDLAALGLAVPTVTVLLDGLELRFGAHDPIALERYVQVGDLVHLIEDRFAAQLAAPPEAWLSRALLPVGFSPGQGSLDGRPLSAGALAALADARADRVEPFAGDLEGAVLQVESADGAAGLRFLVSTDGRRWTRLDRRLTYLFQDPPWSGAATDAPAELPLAPDE